MDSLPQDVDGVEPVEVLCRFRRDFYGCLGARADELFELADAVLCSDGPVRSLADLSLAPEHRRGHGGLYDGINAGRIEVARLRRTLAGLALPRVGERIVLAVDVSPWLRPDAETSPERLFCHVHGRARGSSQMIPGWPYSIVAALQTGRTSWTAVLDAIRLGPDDDATAVTAAQLREVVARLVQAGQWREGDPHIQIVMDSGYDVTRLAFVLADLPVVLVGRLRADRVLLRPAPERRPGSAGRPSRHGPVFDLDQPGTWPPPDHATSTLTTRYGTAQARAWTRLHPRLTHRGAWLDHDGELPIIEGALIRLAVDHLPGDRTPKPVWLWTSDPHASAEDVDRAWQGFLRRFDIEHTFRFLKQHLGWTTPKLRDPDAADRWTWLVIAAHTQLRLARDLTDDLRRRWERPCPPGRLTPARVRRGFRHLRPKIALPASAPKPSRPGPGRPPGSRNHHRAPRHDVGKTTKRHTSPTKRDQDRG
jgi:DDE superfamily endonuclease